MKNQRNSLAIVKSNRLIEASYRLSLTEIRLILLAVSQARKSSKIALDTSPIRIKALDFAGYFGADPKSIYAQLRDAVLSLFSRMVVTHDIDPETGFERVNHLRWISKASYIDKCGDVQLVFAPDIIGHIYNWFEGEFTKYELETVGKLSSVYAVRMYELLMQYKSVGLRSFEINELRNILGLTNEYPAFANFKERVIGVAINQINEYTDLKVKYEASKTGRKFTHLEFKFKFKDTPKKQVKQTHELDTKVAERERENSIYENIDARFNAVLANMSVFEFETRILQYQVMLPIENHFSITDDEFNIRKSALARRLDNNKNFTAGSMNEILNKYFDTKKLSSIPEKNIFLSKLKTDLI
jgi:plasmid replication initiation protein